MAGLKEERSLKTVNASSSIRNQMSGNPVRIRSGCATVTGYELPKATELFISREGGSEVKPEVRIPV